MEPAPSSSGRSRSPLSTHALCRTTDLDVFRKRLCTTFYPARVDTLQTRVPARRVVALGSAADAPHDRSRPLRHRDGRRSRAAGQLPRERHLGRSGRFGVRCAPGQHVAHVCGGLHARATHESAPMECGRHAAVHQDPSKQPRNRADRAPRSFRALMGGLRHRLRPDHRGSTELAGRPAAAPDRAGSAERPDPRGR